MLTPFPAPKLSCVIQVKSGSRDRSGFLGDLGGSVIFEIVKEEKNLITAVLCFPKGRSTFQSLAQAKDMPPGLVRVDLPLAPAANCSQIPTPSLASLSYASSG